MVSLRGILSLFAFSVSLLPGTVYTYPTDGNIPTPDQLQSWLEKKNIDIVEDASGLDIRSDLVVNATKLEERNLFSCFASLCCWAKKPDSSGGGTQMAWLCTNNWPTLDALKSKIQDTGNVGNKISFFYTGLGGGGAIQQAGQWAACHTNYVPASPGFVAWDTIVDDRWYTAQVTALANVFGLNNIDPFQKLLSQAFAETTVGDVYVFTPSGTDPNNPFPGARTSVAWVGWEYPALTRNPNVGTIYRVDPRPGQDNDRHVLWTQGDGPSPDPPLGLYNAPAPP